MPETNDFQLDSAYMNAIFQEVDTTTATITTTDANTEEEQPMLLETPINYNALDSIVISVDGKKVYLYNDAIVTYDEIELSADFIELDLSTNEVYAEGVADTTGVVQGTPVFNDGTDEFECKSLRYNFESQKGIIYDVKTEQGEGYVHSEKTKKIDENSFILRDGKYTTCDADHPHFYLQMTRAKVISNDKIITGRAYMVLEDFPIYFPFIPFGFFPSTPTYSSGIIIPTYGEERNRGFFLRGGGYYWAASQYFDLQLTGDIYSKGSWATYLRTNYKKRYKYSGSFNFSYNVNRYGEEGLPDFYKTSGFNLQWSHSQDSKANPNQNFSAKVNISTSSYDKENATDINEYLQTTKQSSISYSKKWDNSPFSFSASLGHSQNSKTSEMSLRLPNMTLSMTKIYPFQRKNSVGGQKWYEKISIGYTGDIKNSISAPENEILKKNLWKDWKNGWKHTIPITLPSFSLFNSINITPSVSYNERWYTSYLDKTYDYDEQTGDETITDEIIYRFRRNYNYSFSLGSSTTMYGNYIMTNPNWKLKQIRHKITASVGLSYTPDFSDPRFNFWGSYVDKDGNQTYYNRFPTDIAIFGSAGRGESGSINFNVNNNLEAKIASRNDTTEAQYEKISILDNLGFSGSYNMIADSMNLSHINIRGRTAVKGVSVSFGGTLDPYMADSLGNDIATYAWTEKKGIAKLGRLTRANLSFGLSFSSKDSSEDEDEESEEETDDVFDNDRIYGEFRMPWSINMNYSFSYSNPNPYTDPTINQSISFRGTLGITDKWNMTMNTNFDVQRAAFSFTTVSVSRTLHCWNMGFTFVPFGDRKSYSFSLSASSSMLRDLKINKQRSWRDN